jgi:RNA polymerase sigma-70 factor (ECF subfamily)
VRVGSDVDLVELADEELIRTLYADHSAALFGYALRLLGGDRQQAEDVVQETLLRAWRHPEAFRPERGDARPWLRTVAQRLVIDKCRARRARPPEVTVELLAEVPAADELDHLLDAWQMAAVLKRMTAGHRAVLVQTFYLGRSVSEAAAALGVPSGTVKSRAYYALRELRSLLVEQGVTS